MDTGQFSDEMTDDIDNVEKKMKSKKLRMMESIGSSLGIH